MNIEKLEWDSDFFGYKIGKLIINEEGEFDSTKFKDQANDEEYELVYVFKYNSIFSPEIIKSSGLDLMDIQITMAKKFIRNDYKNIAYNFRTDLDEIELKQCYYIAEETSSVSRLSRDILIGPEKTKKLYRKWIDNTLNQTFSDGIFIINESNTVSGLHVIRTDRENNIGFCTLIGVHPMFKRRGIGSKLWHESYGYWANESNVHTIKVPFSFQNSASFNHHLKMGFNKIDEIKYLYHFRAEKSV